MTPLTRKDDKAFYDAIKDRGVISWDDLLCVPNEFKEFTTQRNHNVKRANALLRSNWLRRATIVERDAWIASYNASRASLISQLKEAVASQNWARVADLAQSLEYRTNKDRDEEAANLFYVVPDTLRVPDGTHTKSSIECSPGERLD